MYAISRLSMVRHSATTHTLSVEFRTREIQIDTVLVTFAPSSPGMIRYSIEVDTVGIGDHLESNRYRWEGVKNLSELGNPPLTAVLGSSHLAVHLAADALLWGKTPPMAEWQKDLGFYLATAMTFNRVSWEQSRFFPMGGNVSCETSSRPEVPGGDAQEG